MASKPPHGIAEPVSAVQHYLPPSAREMRAQAVQRLQVGLFGLAGILLVLGLANIINDRARQTEQGSRGVAAAGAKAAKTDPLADIGVVPSAVPEAGPSPVASSSGSNH